MAKPSQYCPPTLIVTELWGLGDVALAVPFLRSAAKGMRVTLVAKPHAAPILARFVPEVDHVPLVAPWTAFRGKYRLHRWPWAQMKGTLGILRSRHFDLGASARPDPRDHVLLALAGAKTRYGFPRGRLHFLLNSRLPKPSLPHRAEHWAALASALGFALEAPATGTRTGRRILIHAGAGQPTRIWPRERFDQLAAALSVAGWQTEIIDDSFAGVERLLEKIDSADRFIGNDSGPGHLAALMGLPTFTLFGPQLPELFSPRHPDSQWIEGAPCPYKPCSDYCRFPEARCLVAVDFETVRQRVMGWLNP